MEQYVITGMGLYNDLGKNTESSWLGLLQGKSTIKPVQWPEDDLNRFPQSYSNLKTNIGGICTPPSPDECIDKFSKYWKDWDPNTRVGLLSVDEAITSSKLTSSNTGVIFSTFGAGTSIRLEVFTAIHTGKVRFSPRKCLNIGLDFPAAQIAAIYGFNGPNTSLDSACTTGLTSIQQAVNTLKAHPELDAMVVGGTDCMFEPIYIFWFQSLGALSPTGTSAPFDTNRNGFVLGEGAGTIIIEPKSKAIARGATIYGIVSGSGNSTLFDSDTSPDPLGNGAKWCMSQAVERAGITFDQIDYVSAHATGTPVGDEIEYNAVAELMPGRVVVSNKGQIGHCMAAAGIIETIYTIQAMNNATTPFNANLTDPIGAGDVVLPTRPTSLNIKYAIKNSFGFGGRNASVVLERWDG